MLKETYQTSTIWFMVLLTVSTFIDVIIVSKVPIQSHKIIRGALAWISREEARLKGRHLGTQSYSS
jgi:hypothetical protein